MRDQAGRDEKTLQIGTGILVFVLVLGLGSVVVAVTQASAEMPDGSVQALFACVFALAAGLAVAAIGGRDRRG